MTSVLPGTPPPGFLHEALFYRGEAEFLEGVSDVVAGGRAAGAAVVVALPRPRLELLRAALDGHAEDVEWHDMAEIGGNPARIIAVWADALERSTAAGRPLVGVGEPAFVGRRPSELVECHLHELLLNTAFDDGPAWRLVCPYDERRLPGAVCTGALGTHPTITGRGPSSGPAPDAVTEAFGAPLPPPTAEGVLRGEFGTGDVPAVRHTVAAWARSCGMAPGRVEDLELAASELASNSIAHGGGAGTVAMWTEPGAAIVEFTDSGRIADPLIGRLHPDLSAVGGRGLWLVNQVVDLVQLRSGPAGTTVRLTTWL